MNSFTTQMLLLKCASLLLIFYIAGCGIRVDKEEEGAPANSLYGSINQNDAKYDLGSVAPRCDRDIGNDRIEVSGFDITSRIQYEFVFAAHIPARTGIRLERNWSQGTSDGAGFWIGRIRGEGITEVAFDTRNDTPSEGLEKVWTNLSKYAVTYEDEDGDDVEDEGVSGSVQLLGTTNSFIQFSCSQWTR